MLNRSFRTGNKRFEFERLHLENPDPWQYYSSAYERQKYERTLACTIKWRSASGSALEIGCSVGAFSQMLAEHFIKVTAVDVSREALHAARDHNHAKTNIHFVRADLRSLDLGTQFDVIICAEVLYYIMEKDVKRARSRLDRHLASNGIIVMVAGVPSVKTDSLYYDGWEAVLSSHFHIVFKDVIEDRSRPYKIIVFRSRH
jgi:2-polyprenyl-3-methyl-5-hydroxy-6-metoxy-1,4-benzoquinol methylase